MAGSPLRRRIGMVALFAVLALAIGYLVAIAWMTNPGLTILVIVFSIVWFGIIPALSRRRNPATTDTPSAFADDTPDHS